MPAETTADPSRASESCVMLTMGRKATQPGAAPVWAFFREENAPGEDCFDLEDEIRLAVSPEFSRFCAQNSRRGVKNSSHRPPMYWVTKRST